MSTISTLDLSPVQKTIHNLVHHHHFISALEMTYYCKFSLYEIEQAIQFLTSNRLIMKARGCYPVRWSPIIDRKRRSQEENDDETIDN
jgi:hypothetical protein